MKIDRERCLRAMRDLQVRGTTEGRGAAIADAIARIQANGSQAMMEEYIGIKNYAGFGDQREDHRYGFGPKHGTIVFCIERADPGRHATLGADHIYLLECVRDFGSVVMPGHEHERNPIRGNLCDMLCRAERLTSKLHAINQAIAAAEVEAHESAA